MSVWIQHKLTLIQRGGSQVRQSVATYGARASSHGVFHSISNSQQTLMWDDEWQMIVLQQAQNTYSTSRLSTSLSHDLIKHII